MQLLVEEADRVCIVNPEEGSVISRFLNEMKAIISSRGDQVADKFEADRAKTGVFLCRLPTFVSPPVVDDTMNLNSLCVCMSHFLLGDISKTECPISTIFNTQMLYMWICLIYFAAHLTYLFQNEAPFL